jgi:glycosyltransferase involved in cell wall biosynthesis
MAACRYGVNISKGAFLCFVDSDDWIDKEMISAMAAELRHHVNEVICGNMITERAKGVFYERHCLAPGVYEGMRHGEIFRNILGNENRLIILSRCVKLISRELITGNLDCCDDGLSMGEDAMLVLAALFDSQRIVIMADAYYYHYYYNPKSLVHAYRADLYRQIKSLHQNFRHVMLRKIKQNKLVISAQEAESQCEKEHLFMLMLALKNEARGNRKGSEYRKNVLEMCRIEGTREKTRKYPLVVAGGSNRILYWVLKHPGFMTAFVLRAAARIFYAGR